MIPTTINVELTDRCNKACWICGRRKREKEHLEIVKTYGDMPFTLLAKIAEQIPPDVQVALHNNGEPLLYPWFGDAVKEFAHYGVRTHATTNGKLLMEKFDEIVGNLDTLAISAIENDPEQLEQYGIIERFIEEKGGRKPLTILRLNGRVDDTLYVKPGCPIARRQLHSPDGSFNYKSSTVIPESGVCWDALHHPAINKDGDVSICVRYDPQRCGVLGNVKDKPLDDILNGEKRQVWINHHYEGRRDLVPLCRTCEYWGIPHD